MSDRENVFHAMPDYDPDEIAALGVEEPLPTRASVLREAERHICGDRNAQYGEPTQDFRRTAAFWGTYLAGVLERKLHGEWNGEFDFLIHPSNGLSAQQVDALRRELKRICVDMMTELIDPHDVAWMQILLKTSRSCVSPAKRDHYVDVAGYSGCGADCAELLE